MKESPFETENIVKSLLSCRCLRGTILNMIVLTITPGIVQYDKRVNKQTALFMSHTELIKWWRPETNSHHIRYYQQHTARDTRLGREANLYYNITIEYMKQLMDDFSTMTCFKS